MATGSRPRAWGYLAVRLPRTGRHARASGPSRAGSCDHFLHPVEVELIVRMLENYIQKYCMNFAGYRWCGC